MILSDGAQPTELDRAGTRPLLRVDLAIGEHCRRFDPAWPPGLYLLEASSCGEAPRHLKLSFSGIPTRTVRLPVTRASRQYIVRIRHPIDKIRLECRENAGDPLSLELRRLSSAGALALRLLHRNRLRSQRFRLSPDEYAVALVRDRRGALTSDIEWNNEQALLRQLGLADGSAILSRHPEIDTGWESVAGEYRPTKPPRVGPIGVVLHLHYTELWPEIDACLRNSGHPFDLHVTLSEANDVPADLIRSAYPSAEIHTLPNRGRDVGPFFELLTNGHLDRYRYILKIHGKMSRKGGQETLLGRRWRRASLVQLLTATGRVDSVLNRFDQEPTLGLIGPATFRVPSAEFPEHHGWGKSKTNVVQLAQRIGVRPRDVTLNYFAGTMFWVRPPSLAPLRALALRQSDFPDEAGQLDGTLQHALERLFTVSAMRAGYTVEETGKGIMQAVSEPHARAAGF